MFRDRLVSVCAQYRIPSVVEKWSNCDVSSRLCIVLGSSFDFFGKEVPREFSPEDAARDLRLVSNQFLLSLWSVRKKLQYSDLAIPLAGGANVPLCGSAS